MANVYDLPFISGVIVEATGMASVYDLPFIAGMIVKTTDMGNAHKFHLF